MLIGDPENFAIIIESVNAWNETKDFCEGVLLFCVDGELFPKGALHSATLAHELYSFSLMDIFVYPTVNKELFTMKKEDAFIEIYNITFPEDWSKNNNYCYDITPDCFSDCGCFVFAVSNGQTVRILAAQREYYDVQESKNVFTNSVIKETYIEIDDFKQFPKAFNIFMKAYEKDVDNLGI